MNTYTVTVFDVAGLMGSTRKTDTMLQRILRWPEPFLAEGRREYTLVETSRDVKNHLAYRIEVL